jgi:hypothetical protein
MPGIGEPAPSSGDLSNPSQTMSVRHAIAVPHCISAIHSALLAEGIEKGDEVRLRMGCYMVLHAIAKRDLNAIKVVSAYRRIRERLAAKEVLDFEQVLIAETAKAASMSPECVHAVVSEWIETRPLCYLRSCLFSGVLQLFAGLQRAGKRIGVFSDHPATAKLAAMGLAVITSSRPAMSGCSNLMPEVSNR